MPIFISYSHQDKDFVDKLASQLVLRKQYIWLDRWELKVGDSIIGKIQSAIKTASALIVVLSKASVGSSWCEKELSAGLIRELEEKRVVVLPVLLEDCDIPMFLRDKKYADFRTSFDEGLRETHLAIAAITSNTQGRIENPEFHTDWGISWGHLGDRYVLHLRFVDHSEQLPYCVLTEIQIIANEAMTQKMHSYEEKGIGWFGRAILISALDQAVKEQNAKPFVLEDSFPRTKTLHFMDAKTGIGHEVVISSVWLGNDTGMLILVDYPGHIEHVLQDLNRDITPTDRENLRRAFGLPS